jgi:hypothetical protein
VERHNPPPINDLSMGLWARAGDEPATRLFDSAPSCQHRSRALLAARAMGPLQ